MMERKDRTRGPRVSALVAVTVTLVTVALAAPVAVASEPNGDASLLSLETSSLTVGVRLKVLEMDLTTPALDAPVPTGVGTPATTGAVTDALPVDASASPLPRTTRAGTHPAHALLLDDAHVHLLPDGSVTLTMGSGGSSDGIATKIARTGHALTFTGLTVTFPDLSDGAGLGDATHALPGGGDVALAAHDRLAYTPADAAHAPLAAPRAPGDAEATSATPHAGDADLSAASARASANAPTRALAEKAALAAAALGLPALLGWTLYHRMRGPAVLNNKTRNAIHDAIASEPGIGVQELSERLDVSYSTTMYHLTRLQNAHMIVQSQDGNKLRYYKNGGAFNEQERHVLPLLKNREVLRVLSIILENPGTYRAEIAARMGVTATTVNWHLKRLVKHDLVLEERQGRSAHLYVDQTLLTKHLEPLVPKLQDAEDDLAEVAQRLVATAHAVPTHAEANAQASA